MRKTVTNRLCFPSLFQSLRQEPGSIATAGTSCSTFFLHFITGLLKPLQLIHCNGRKKGLRVCEVWRQEKSKKIYFAKINQSCLTNLVWSPLYRPSPGFATGHSTHLKTATDCTYVYFILSSIFYVNSIAVCQLNIKEFLILSYFWWMVRLTMWQCLPSHRA